MKFLKMMVLLVVAALGLTACGGGGGGTAQQSPQFGQVLATPTSTNVHLSWTAVPNAVGYNIYISTNQAFTVASNTPADSTVFETSFDHTGVVGSTTYYYYVVALDGSGNALVTSDKITVTVPESIDAPKGLIATPANGAVTLDWLPVTGATSYKVFWSTSPVVPTTDVNKTKTVSTTSTTINFTNDQKQYFIVVAVKTAGVVESVPCAAQSAIPSATPAPANPGVLSATNTTIGNLAKWRLASPANDSYRIYASLTPGFAIVDGNKVYDSATDSGTLGSVSTFDQGTDPKLGKTFPALSATEKSYVRVVAVKGGVPSEPSPEFEVLPLTFESLTLVGHTVKYDDNTTVNDHLTLAFTSDTAVTVSGTLGGVPITQLTGTWSVSGTDLSVNTSAYSFQMQIVNAGPPITISADLFVNGGPQRDTLGFGTLTIL